MEVFVITYTQKSIDGNLCAAEVVCAYSDYPKAMDFIRNIYMHEKLMGSNNGLVLTEESISITTDTAEHIYDINVFELK